MFFIILVAILSLAGCGLLAASMQSVVAFLASFASLLFLMFISSDAGLQPSIGSFMVFTVYFVVISVLSAMAADNYVPFKSTSKSVGPLSIAGALICGIAVVISSLASAPLFRAEDYRDLVTISKVKYGVPELTQNSRIAIDIDLAKDLMAKNIPSEISSKFQLGKITRQADSRGNIQYVAPLEHLTVLGAVFNGSTPGYIKMDATDINSITFVSKDAKGESATLNYSEEAVGLHDVSTNFRLAAMGSRQSAPYFYIDDNGKPYWVTYNLTPRVGLLGWDSEGVFVMDAKTGDVKEYSLKNAPSWIDRLFETDTLEERIDDHFKYVHGFWNGSRTDIRELIGKADYVQIGNQTYLYMSIGNSHNTSITTGAVLVNARTREVSYYERKVMAESEVASAAEQAYREKGYSAGNPVMRSIEGNLVFVVQMHGQGSSIPAYVIRSAYPQGVLGNGATLSEAYQNYLQKATESSALNMAKNVTYLHAEGVIQLVGQEVVAGNSVYSIKLQNDDKIYVIARTVAPELPLLKPGVKIAIEYRPSHQSVFNVSKLAVTNW